MFVLPLDFHGTVFCMVLRRPIWLSVVCVSYTLLFFRLLGPVVSPRRMWVRCSACWMVLRSAILLAYRPDEMGRVCHLLGMVTEACPGHGPVRRECFGGWVSLGSRRGWPCPTLLKLPFLMPGRTRLLPTFVLVKALEVVRCFSWSRSAFQVCDS